MKPSALRCYIVMMSSEKMKTLLGLFNFSPVPMWIYDARNLHILAVNDAACRCYGYARDKFLAQTVDALWPGRNAGQGKEQLRHIAGSEHRHQDMVTHVTACGQLITVELASEIMPDWGAHARIMSALDVTERERAIEVEKQLRRSNERFNYASKASHEAIYDWDIVTDNIHWADGFCRVFGYPLDGRKYPVKSWIAMIHPDDRDAIEQLLESSLADQHCVYWNAHYRLRHALDGYLFVEETGYIIRDNTGKPLRIIGALRDITEQQQVAMALEASEKRYSDLFHLSPLPMWVYDLQTYRFLDVNKAAIALYGYSREEFLSMSITDIRRPEDREELMEMMRKNVRPQEYHSALVRHLKKSGEKIIVNVNGNSIPYGDAAARIVVAIDVTDKIRSREALANSERRFRRLIQEGSELITVLDEYRRIKYISPAGEHFLGMKAEHLLGTYAFASVHPEDVDELLDSFDKLDQEKRVEPEPFRIIDKKGEIHWVETIITDMRDDETIQGIITNSRDVTQRMLADAERMRYISEIEAHNARLEEITWTQAHLVRAPLARILGIVQLLSDKDTETTTRDTLMSYLQVSATELDDIIRKIIEKSRASQQYP